MAGRVKWGKGLNFVKKTGGSLSRMLFGIIIEISMLSFASSLLESGSPQEFEVLVCKEFRAEYLKHKDTMNVHK